MDGVGSFGARSWCAWKGRPVNEARHGTPGDGPRQPTSDLARDALQRTLLNTDGTVVRLLEAWFHDPIGLASQHQFTTPVQPTDAELHADGTETILRRRVLLHGRHSGRNYVHAEATVVLDRLPSGLREQLLTTAEPIGRLLRRHRVETFREILRTGQRPAGPLADDFSIDSADTLLYRVYRLWTGGRPVMLIAEHFPADPPLHPSSEPDVVVELDADDQSAPHACGSS